MDLRLLDIASWVWNLAETLLLAILKRFFIWLGIGNECLA
jgi:hypothetical protein